MTDRRYVVDCELRATAGDDFKIEGRALSYNKLSNPNCPAAGCREKLQPGCFRALGTADVLMYYNHNSDNLLGRTSNGTLQLRNSNSSLDFSLKLNPNISLHRDIRELVKDKTLRSMSFGFQPTKDAWEDGKDPDNGSRCSIRTVTEAKLFEISLVPSPAYPDTDAQARSYDFAHVTDEEVRQELEANELADRYADLVERYQGVRIF